jgi:hypothetical protein
MSTHAPAALPRTFPPSILTPEQWRALEALRQQHPEYAEFFTHQELARLCFVRWLYQTKRLVP